MINKTIINQRTADILFHDEGNTLEQMKRHKDYHQIAGRKQRTGLKLFIRFQSEEKPASFPVSAEQWRSYSRLHDPVIKKIHTLFWIRITHRT